MVGKALIICGPTATGKTKFALEIAKKLNGELVSADSRQVYIGKNIVHGKDLPPHASPQISNLHWRGRNLVFYTISGIKIWLYDVVHLGEPFSLAFWKECADTVIADIRSRNKLPIVVGGTGLYIKSLFKPLSNITIPPNKMLRQKLASKSAKYLLSYLNKIDSFRVAVLNISDRQNPRRLTRAIEISLSTTPPSLAMSGDGDEVFAVGLTAPLSHLYQLVDQRVLDRIAAGAASEDPQLAQDPQKWQYLEHRIVRRQLTWFKKQPSIVWFDITSPDWSRSAQAAINSWYNSS